MNNLFSQIKEFISTKRSGICLGSTKSQNKGAYLLAEWDNFEEEIDGVITDSLIRLQKYFSDTSNDTDPGSTKLTSFITSVGYNILRRMKRFKPDDTTTWYNACDIGAVFISALVDSELVTIDRNCGYLHEKSRNAPLMIHATELWRELKDIVEHGIIKAQYGVSFTKPPLVSTMINPDTLRPYVKKQTSKSDFNQMKDSVFIKQLNHVQGTSWKINRRILQTVVGFKWDNTIPEIPTEGSNHRVDAALKEMKLQEKKFNKGHDNTYEEAKQKYADEATKWANKRDKLKERSKIIDRLITIERAKSLIDQSHFYYHVEADYRGRIYYTYSFLNYQSGDLSKALLEFAEPVKLTAKGFDWLLIHAACCFNQEYSKDELDWTDEDYASYLNEKELESISVDKMSLADRLKWSKLNISMLLSTSRLNIIHNHADKPWMLLAACHEITSAMEAINNGEEFLTHLPVPIDGTCNGSQHAAAINKDTRTGSKVGLTPTAFPIDLYLEVGKEMTEIEPEFFEERNMPYKSIRKNISKRATMTRAYSAGRKSISDSMFADCYKSGATEDYNITAGDCFMLAKAAMEAIDIVCPANASVRYYLQELVKFELGSYTVMKDGEEAEEEYYDILNQIYCAEEDVDTTYLEEELDQFSYELVRGNGSNEINWVAPSGFIVRCKLNRTKQLKTRISILSKQHKIAGIWPTNKPDMRKHISAIAANYIHSQDASHQAFVICEWFKAGNNSFAAVHDSFAVHASGVDQLVEITKDEFIQMYDHPNYYEVMLDNILTNREDFDEPMPRLGKLDLNRVKRSDYFFS